MVKLNRTHMTDEELNKEGLEEVIADDLAEETRQIQTEDEFSMQELAEMANG
jgi:hypothetical protein